MSRILTASDGTARTVALGEYRRVGSKATGKAYLIVSADALTYCNRRGEIKELTEAVALTTMATWTLQTEGPSVLAQEIMSPLVPVSDLIVGPRALILA
jgi:hypothetical protein